jgi:hypothetical protein
MGACLAMGGDASLEALGFDVHLPDIPPPEKLWSTRGVKAYHTGGRPDPADVFQRLMAVINHFLDFDRSWPPSRRCVSWWPATSWRRGSSMPLP